MSSAGAWSASVWSRIARSWRAESSRPMMTPTAGADAAGVQEEPGCASLGAEGAIGQNMVLPYGTGR